MALHFRKAVEQLKSGDRVMVTHPRPGTQEDVVYGFVGCGKKISKTAYHKMTGAKLLSPVADGLFGAEIFQTFEWSGVQ